MSYIVQEIIEKHDTNPANLIPILQDVQSEDGYLSRDALADIAQLLGISESTIYGVATFYTQFKFIKPGEHQIKLCQGTACHVKGSNTLLDVMKTSLKIEPGETTEDGKVSLERVACLGCCALAPVIVLDDEVHGKMTQDSTSKLLKTLTEEGSDD